jgi:hypothetical protein
MRLIVFSIFIKILYAYLVFLMGVTCPIHLILLNFVTLIISAAQNSTYYGTPHYVVFHCPVEFFSKIKHEFICHETVLPQLPVTVD